MSRTEHGTLSHPRRQERSTVADCVAAALQRHGVDVMFGQSLPTLIHLAGAPVGLRQVSYRTENAGAAMADGYARVSGRVAVVTAQNGPAATLLVPGLAEALKASVPVVALVQDIPRDRAEKNAFQDLDHLALFAPCTKWVRRVDQAHRVEDFLDMAFTRAASGRPGPVALLFPSDLLLEAGPEAGLRSHALGRCPLDRGTPVSAAVEEAAERIVRARNPIVIAGGGVHASQAWGELGRLQDLASIPVATTTMGKGAVDETHPLSVGVVGYFMGTGSRTKFLRPWIADADVVLLVGTRTAENGTDSWQLYPPAAHYIHVDIDPEEVGRNYEAQRLVGDARATLALLLDALQRRDLTMRAAARPHVESTIAEARRRHQAEAWAGEADAAPVRPERLMAELDRILGPDDIVVADASYSSIWMANNLTARAGGMRFLSPRGLAGLGWGLPMALGAKVARPDRRVFCLVGDGGFGHCWSELETAARMRLPVVLMVLNNQVLGYQKHAELVKFGAHTDAVALASVDHAAIARACGCHGIRVERPAEIAPALAEAAGRDELSLLDVMTDAEAYPPITTFDGRLPTLPPIDHQPEQGFRT